MTTQLATVQVPLHNTRTIPSKIKSICLIAILLCGTIYSGSHLIEAYLTKRLAANSMVKQAMITSISRDEGGTVLSYQILNSRQARTTRIQTSTMLHTLAKGATIKVMQSFSLPGFHRTEIELLAASRNLQKYRALSIGFLFAFFVFFLVGIVPTKKAQGKKCCLLRLMEFESIKRLP